VTLGAVLAGCNLFFPGLVGPGPMGSFGDLYSLGDLSSFDVPLESFGEPSLLATYRTGSATIRLGDGTTIRLTTVRAGSQLMSSMGAAARWSDASGWNLIVDGAASDGSYGDATIVELDRIADNEHLTTLDSGGCSVKIDLADRTGLRGSASCKGLIWTDALDLYGPVSAASGQAPFDAEITFSAAP